MKAILTCWTWVDYTTGLTVLVVHAVVSIAVAGVVSVEVLQQTRVPDAGRWATGSGDSNAAGRLRQDLGQDVAMIDVILVGDVVDAVLQVVHLVIREIGDSVLAARVLNAVVVDLPDVVERDPLADGRPAIIGAAVTVVGSASKTAISILVVIDTVHCGSACNGRICGQRSKDFESSGARRKGNTAIDTTSSSKRRAG